MQEVDETQHTYLVLTSKANEIVYFFFLCVVTDEAEAAAPPLKDGNKISCGSIVVLLFAIYHV